MMPRIDIGGAVRGHHCEDARGAGDGVSDSTGERASDPVSPANREPLRGERRFGRGTHHDGDVELEGDVLEELEAVHVGHVDVAEDDVEVVASLAKRLERLGASHERRHWGAEGEGVVCRQG